MFIPVEIYGSPQVIVEQVCGKTLSLLNLLDLKSGELSVQYLQEIHNEHSYQAQGPTAALSAVISSAASIAAVWTGGAAWAAEGLVSVTGSSGAAASVISAMGSAGFSSLCAQGALAMVKHKGHIGRAANQFAKHSSITSLLEAMASAGLTRGIGNFPARIAMGLARGEKPEHIVTGVVVDEVAKFVATKIGQGRLSYAPHKMAHLALGAGMGAASAAVMGRDVEQAAFTAGLGALVSEVIADAMLKPDELGQRAVEKAKAEGLPMTEETLMELVKADSRGTIDFSRLSAGVVAMVSGQDVDLAIKAATNAVENNCLPSLALAALKSPAARAALEAAKRGTAALLKKAEEIVDKVVKAAKLIDKATSSGGGGTGDLEPDDEHGKDHETNVEQGKSQAPDVGEPNSIYEQLGEKGEVRSRTFYDQNGRQFSRQDYDHLHWDKTLKEYISPHEHLTNFDAAGRPIAKQIVKPLPSGYPNVSS